MTCLHLPARARAVLHASRRLINAHAGQVRESHSICQCKSCPNQGATYSEASRRVFIESVQILSFPVVLNGLSFPCRQITVDLCVSCYHRIKRDQMFKILSVVPIGPYAEEQA